MLRRAAHAGLVLALMATATGIGARALADPPRAAGAAEPAWEQVLKALFPVAVQVVLQRQGTAYRWGSGVMIATAGSECRVITAGHTVARLGAGDEVSVLLDRHRPAPPKVRAEVLAARDDEQWDLAVLTIPRACAPARTGPPPELGDPIWVIGFPHGGEMTVGGGIVSQITRARPGGPPRFTVDASASHGSSGAGVFDARTGRLIGLVEAFGTARVAVQGNTSPLHVDVPLPGMTYVTPADRIEEFVQATVQRDRLAGGK